MTERKNFAFTVAKNTNREVDNMRAEHVKCRIIVVERDEEITMIENAKRKERNKVCGGWWVLIKLQFLRVYSSLCNYTNNTRLTGDVCET
jgi:hypothetical protein